MDVKKFTEELCSLMSIDGFEYMYGDELKKLVLPYFDSVEEDSLGNFIFLLKSKKKNAKKLFIDAHYDEIGMIVKGITDDGMLRVTKDGGVDARLLPASEVTVYGTETVKGIVAVKPGRLIPPEERDKLVPLSELLVDIGYPKSKAEKIAPIGTPVGFAPDYVTLGDGKYISGKSFDDKLCAVSVIKAISLLDRKKLGCDIYFSLSAKEETGGDAVPAAVFRIKPDLSIVLDVTFGFVSGGDKSEKYKMGGGPVVSHSLMLDEELTEFIEQTAAEKNIAVQYELCPSKTGTHADDITFVGDGSPVALLGIPIWFMHTQSETAAISDIEDTARLLAAVIEKKFGREEKDDE